MRLQEDERQIMVNLEYERACICLKQAEGNASMGFWDVVKVGTHKGAMLMFGQHYVRTGIFTAEDSKLYSNLQMMREESDYNCVYVTTAEEMQPLFEPVREFLVKIGNLIKE